jgi:hypothetical protein
VVDLGNGGKDRSHQHEGERRPQIRQRHVAQPLPPGGAVEVGDLVGLGRDRLKAGQEEQHVVAGVLPHGERRDRIERHVRIAQPIRPLHAELSEVVVEQADTRQEDEQEHRGRSDQRDQHGQEKDRAQRRVDAGRVVERQRKRKRQHQARHDGAGRVGEIVRERAAKSRIGKNELIVAQAE